jgi:hypothetical protein
MEAMKFLVTVAVAVILALPVTLSAQTGNAGSPAQNSPAKPGVDTAPNGNTSAQPQQPKTGSKKKAKVKKAGCVSPPADSGLPDYCKNPYWDPKDWIYIMENSGGHR